MHRLAPIAVIVLALTGCDPSVEARYQPTSVDEIFGIEQDNGVARDVYQLPAPPPALGEGDLLTRSCRPPGVRQKPTDMVGLRHDEERIHRIEPTLLVASYEPPLPSPPPGPSYRIASWNQHQEVGAKEPIATPIEPGSLQPGRSVYRNEPVLYGSYRTDVYAWCNDEANRRR